MIHETQTNLGEQTPSRPNIPAEMRREVLYESGNHCAVCGAGAPLELAHIIPWSQAKEHRGDNLICLCANCHERADREHWGRKLLLKYKRTPWIERQLKSFPLSGKTKIILTVPIPLNQFTDTASLLLKHNLANLLEASPSAIEIISIAKGSTIVTLKLPKKTASKLLSFFQKDDPRLSAAFNPFGGLVNIFPGPPPKPRLVVRVGVTGHRPNRLPQEGVEHFRQKVQGALQQLKDITEELFTAREDSRLEIYSDELPHLRLISPLAEGSDRIVAEEALKIGYELQSPLPFLRDEYENDFATQESKKDFRHLLDKASAVLELDVSRAAENEAYEAVGRVVLRQCDILIAVWDGNPEEGVGGTGQVVRESLSLEIPTIWIQSKPPHTVKLVSPTEPKSFTGDFREALAERLKTMFLFTPQESFQKQGKQRLERERSMAARFFVPLIHQWHFGFIFRLFRSFWCLKIENKNIESQIHHQCPDVSQFKNAWQGLFEANQKFKTSIERNYTWADALANYYGSLYRSSFILTFSMGSVAVLFAFLGFYMHRSTLHYLWFALELSLIIIISTITWRGRKNHWHGRWMDYRLLAESLRQLRFLAPLGRITLSFKVPAHIQASDPRNSWVNWYFRALAREGGMIDARFDEKHLRLSRSSIESVVCEQIAYHESNHENLDLLASRLHRVAQWLFGTAAVACIFHFTPELWLHEAVSLALNLATIVLPAFGAALSAISHQGEFERLAIRSEALTERLVKLKTREIPSETGISSRELGRAAEVFSEIMFGELLDWRFAFLEKQMELPA